MRQGRATPQHADDGLTKVDIVIVNWNAGRQLRECVESIFLHEDEALGLVIVVDNASADGSADFCRTDPRVLLIEPGRNLGFGAACNLGAAQGSGDYVLFLNPDTRLLEPTLRTVTSFMERPSSAGVGVCGVRLVGEGGATARHCSRLPSPAQFFVLSAGLSGLMPRLFRPLELIEFDHRHDAEVPHVMGAFYFIRRGLFEKLGGFDLRFFVYHEDLDLSLRVKQAGCSTYYLAEPRVFHRTAGTTQQGASAKALSYLLESRLAYGRKHFSAVGFATVLAAVLLIEPLRRFAHALVKWSPDAARNTAIAYDRLWRAIMGRRIDRA